MKKLENISLSEASVRGKMAGTIVLMRGPQADRSRAATTRPTTTTTGSSKHIQLITALGN